MLPKSKARRAKANSLEIARRKKKRLEENEGDSSEVRAESLEGNYLNELLNMSEDALDTDNESGILLLMLRLVKEWMKVMLVRGFVNILCHGWTLIRELARCFLSFQLEKL